MLIAVIVLSALLIAAIGAIISSLPSARSYMSPGLAFTQVDRHGYRRLNDGERIGIALHQIEGKRLMYREPSCSQSRKDVS
jgi:hypothetical protein